jgi:putative hemolysin
MKIARLFAAAAALCSLLAGVTPASAASTSFGFPQFAASDAADIAAAASYCTSTGGTVETRRPVYGTNNPPSKWLYLAGSAQFCDYAQKKGGETTDIWVLLSTLYTTKPTLAVLAYDAKVKFNNSDCPGGASPGSCYCTQLGGTDQFGGQGLGGGAWVLKGNANVALDTCIFPDLSSIDAYGLFYHSAGIIRGKDLTKVLRYHHG